MSGVPTDRNAVVFAQLTGAYWLDDAAEDAIAVLEARRGQLPQSGVDPGLAGRLVRSRMVILSVAVVTVAAALLVGLLA